MFVFGAFFFSSRRRHTRFLPVSWARRCVQETAIKIWKYNSQNREFTQIQQFQDHSEWVRDVAWNPSIGAIYDLVASCSDDQTVIIRSLDRKTQNLINSKILRFDGPVWHISWSLQGNMISVSYAANNNIDNICQIYQENVQGDWELVKSNFAEQDQLEQQQQQI
eukprot:TRINITY_DN8930_c0_g2_i1.p2 TRINITY_DN8930_c0_g2~~TRINITY_DN8930_c0_g2_i1.p2  ORF type:complete len:165 (-),score=29.43 TRINITY_DN8930_c0_g2_i1:114-608(-)